MDVLEYHRRPALRAPFLLVAFAGWPDAASVASRGLGYLRDRLPAERIGEIRPDAFFNFTDTRPVVMIREGVVQRMRFPSFELSAWRDPRPDAEHDALLLVGTEPNLRWQQFIEVLMSLVEEQQVSEVCLLGGLNDRVPHTRPPRVSAVVTHADLKPRLRAVGATFSEYEGPSSIHTSILMACLQRDVRAFSVWGHVPSYAQVLWNPKVSHALLTCVTGVLGLSVDLEALRLRGAQLDEMLNRLVRQNPELETAIQQLEAEYDEGQARGRTRGAEDLGRLSENVIRQIEELLGGQRGEREEGEGNHPEG